MGSWWLWSPEIAVKIRSSKREHSIRTKYAQSKYSNVRTMGPEYCGSPVNNGVPTYVGSTPPRPRDDDDQYNGWYVWGYQPSDLRAAWAPRALQVGSCCARAARLLALQPLQLGHRSVILSPYIRQWPMLLITIFFIVSVFPLECQRGYKGHHLSEMLGWPKIATPLSLKIRTFWIE